MLPASSEMDVCFALTPSTGLTLVKVLAAESLRVRTVAFQAPISKSQDLRLLDAMPALESRELSCRFCYFLDILSYTGRSHSLFRIHV
jgi:hypothetical protein